MHNHPSGDPTSSRADIAMTQQIVEAARPRGIAVHDHIIVGRDGHASLKALLRAFLREHSERITAPRAVASG